MHIDDDGDSQFAEDDVLDLDTEIEDDAPDPDGDEDGESPEPFVGFVDDGEDEEDAPPLVKDLRTKLRDTQRELARERRTKAQSPTGNDPEPIVPERPRSVTDPKYNYDEDKFNEDLDAHLAAKDLHTEWKARQSERERSVQREQEERGKRVEQQRRALGIPASDYEIAMSKVKDVLSEGQLLVMTEASDNPTRLIVALGNKAGETRLDLLAGQNNLAKFAAMIGTMEKEIKVSKRTAPAPESRVRGATAPVAAGSADKREAALEAKAQKTGDRTELIRYRADKKKRAA